MLEIMFQGHGGHGSVVAAKLVAQAAAGSGYQAQSFASYGALRRGGKVEGYVRISDEPLLLRCKMYEADVAVVMDHSLLEDEKTLHAVKEGGKVLINASSRIRDEYPSLSKFEVFTVDAYGIAREKGLVIPGGMPVINTTLLGALSGVLDIVPIEEMIAVIRAGTPHPEKNVECAMAGYQSVLSEGATGTQKFPLAEGVTPGAKPGGRFPAYSVEKMEKCHRCQICYMACPSLAIGFDGDPLRFFVNKEVCTGCGICIHECPRHAISWEEQ